MTPRPTVIGTRGSRLALAQSELVATSLRRCHPGLALRLEIVSTEGDRITAGPLPSWGRGVFVRDIETALLHGEIDLAVHSMKDIPPLTPEGLAILAVPRRVDPGDVLVTVDGRELDDLPAGARVGTSSLRRAAFLRAYRADLRIVPVRGNVDTRWRKLLDPSQGFDAIILAAAGLERLELAGVRRVPIPFDVLLPAPGQGALALEGRASDAYHREVAAGIGDVASGAAVAAERRLVRDLDSGCRLPVAALATPGVDGTLRLEAAVAAPDGSNALREGASGHMDDPHALGQAVARRLLDRGAADLLAQAHSASTVDSPFPVAPPAEAAR
ncbi:MAG: hydroxymethylbilane synthase [Chloroflexota bacterium]|nr:hydroxymethylbilane synthase [Chloroflexota bacterium]